MSRLHPLTLAIHSNEQNFGRKDEKMSAKLFFLSIIEVYMYGSWFLFQKITKKI